VRVLLVHLDFDTGTLERERPREAADASAGDDDAPELSHLASCSGLEGQAQAPAASAFSTGSASRFPALAGA